MRFIGILILCLWLVPTRSLPAAQTPDLVGASTQFGPIAVTQNGTIFTYAPSVPGFISYLTKIAADGTSQVVRLPSGLMNEIIAFGSDHAGNLYFTTPNGGSVVFPAALTINKMAADGSLSIVAQLDLPGAGESSAVGSGQSSFSVDGTGNCYYYNMLTGLIKKISPNGNINTLKNLSMIYQLSRISVDNFGNIYGLTFPGAQIIKISSDGNISTFFPGSPPKFGNFLAVDSIGDVYTFTGSDGNLTEVTPDGTAVSLDVVGLTGSNSSRISGIAVDADDTLYVASNNASQTPLNAIGERTRDGRIHLLTPSRINGPSGLAVDIGGMVYVANQHDGTISRISPDGTISTFAANLHRPSGLAFDTSGILYVADYASNSIKKITPDGNVSLFASSLINGPNAITFDKLGNLYVSNVGSNLITRVTPTGLSSIYSSSDAIDGPLGLTFGPNGNLFVTDFGQDRVVIITPDGSVLPDNGTGVHAQGITTTPDGTIYAINYSAVTSITSDGSAVSPPLSGFEEGLFVLTSDATGNLYLANTNRNAIEKLAVAPSPLVAAILPGARSVQQGSVATVFATIINTGSLPLGNCGISLPAQDQATKSLAFQTTDPSTNVAIGRSNQFVSIAAHGQQSYVLAITAPNDSVGQPFIFTCDGVQPVANLSGINTLDLFVRSNPIPDIIPIAVTPSHDGIAAIPHGQAAAFAVAGVNIGGTATVTIDTTTGSAGLPLNLTICETNPANGQCFAPPVFSLQRAFPANGPPATFSVFLTASTAIPLAPQASRVYVRFTDQKDGTSASTSVAVMAK